MSRYQSPHFEHHRREIKLTRRRFQLALMLLFVGLSVGVGLHYQGSRAATTLYPFDVGGRAYNATTGAGIPNVRINICDYVTVVTDSSGNYFYQGSTNVPYLDYCVSYAGGAPTYLSGPVAVNNRPDVGTQSTYEFQIANKNCYHYTSYQERCYEHTDEWDRATDTGFDFRFTGTPPSTPTPVPTPKPPTPAPTPTPVPKTPTPKPSTPTPGSTPKPSSTPVPGGGGGGSVITPRPGAAATPNFVSPGRGASPGGQVVPVTSDTTPPGAPGNFQAVVAGDSAIIGLSWLASEDASGIKEYKLERSLDQTTWTQIPETITDVTYTDDSVAFSIHYFYRILAIDNAGNASSYAMSDVTTPQFSSNANVDGDTTYVSEDHVATVILRKGAISVDAVCSVVKDGSYGEGTKQRPVIAGPFRLACKGIDGEVIGVFSRPLAWTYNLHGKLEGLNKPGAYTYPSSNLLPVQGAKFDEKSGIMKFEMTTSESVVIYAYEKGGISLNLVVVVAAVILAIIGVGAMILRRRQKGDYEQYLRSKYYNM